MASRTLLRPTLSSLRQHVLQSEHALVIELVCTDLPTSEAVDLELSDDTFRLQLAGRSTPIVVSTTLKICADASLARFSKRRSCLSVRGPLSAPAPSWASHADTAACLRVTVSGVGRGAMLTIIPISAETHGADCFVLVSRSGHAPTLEGGYTWCHTFEASEQTTCVEVSIDTVAWAWDSPEALIAFGTLSADDQPPSIDPSMAQLGVEFALSSASMHVAGGVADRSGDEAPVTIEFLPEERSLPSDELRRGVRCDAHTA